MLESGAYYAVTQKMLVEYSVIIGVIGLIILVIRESIYYNKFKKMSVRVQCLQNNIMRLRDSQDAAMFKRAHLESYIKSSCKTFNRKLILSNSHIKDAHKKAIKVSQEALLLAEEAVKTASLSARSSNLNKARLSILEEKPVKKTTKKKTTKKKTTKKTTKKKTTKKTKKRA